MPNGPLYIFGSCRVAPPPNDPKDGSGALQISCYYLLKKLLLGVEYRVSNGYDLIRVLEQSSILSYAKSNVQIVKLHHVREVFDNETLYFEVDGW